MAAPLEAPVSGEPLDVAVIGGSLAGSAAACALAREGFRVAVLEHARFPRAKVCGEFLSHEALPVLSRMGALAAVRAAGAEAIDRFSVVSPSGRRVGGPLPAPVLSVTRETLDRLCLEAAREAGASVRGETTVTGIAGGLDAGFRLATTRGEVRARAVLGCWGRYSPLDGKLGRPFFGAAAPLFGFQRHLSAPPGRFAGEVVLHPFPGGYLGLSRVEGGRVNLAALATPAVAREAHHDLDRLLARLTAASPALARDLEGLVPLPGPTLLSEPVHLGARDAVAGDVLLSGDAAGVVDPWTGTGMSLALLTGEAASPALASFLRGEVDADGLRDAHRADVRRVQGSRLLLSRLLRPVFVSPLGAALVHPALAPLARLLARLTRGRVVQAG
ncbi:MAG: hypothetical protein EDX89_06805 [Acidobacteria bacterium]|nr:MAG: hypothetical protein EDX89_06805 [Acidobacteriota bacterium]MCE7959418.1 hypothetical protein [Acidobacteria bacterium ACB2]